jgi:hypothetical protein
LEDLRGLAAMEAEFVEKTEYGDKFRVGGILVGPNGKELKVISIWLTEQSSGITKL